METYANDVLPFELENMKKYMYIQNNNKKKSPKSIY